MVWQWVVKSLLGTSVRERVYQTVADEVRTRADEVRQRGDSSAGQCDVGVVFALGQESGSLEDRLEQTVTNHADGLKICQGRLGEEMIAAATVGVGRAAAKRGTEALLTGHDPRLVVSAGFAGGLTDELPRETVLVAERVIDEAGSEFVPTARADVADRIVRCGALGGTLVTCDQVVPTEEAKRALATRSGACAVDMETAAVADVCARRDVPWLSVRIVLDAVEDKLPAAVERLARQKTAAGRLGAAMGAVVSQPESLKQMWALKERSLVCADRLAEAIVCLTANRRESLPKSETE